MISRGMIAGAAALGAVLLCFAIAEMPIAEDELIIEEIVTPQMETADDEPILNTPEPVQADGEYAMDSAEDTPYTSIRIRAVGDVMVHQRQLDLALQMDGSYDFHDMFSYVSASLADADLTIANLETTIDVNDTRYRGYPTFNSPVSLLDTLKDAGIDYLTLANNHILDSLYDGLCSTVDQVDAYGFAHDGAYRTQEEANTPVLRRVNGITVGFLSYTEMTNDMERYCAPEATEYGVRYLKNADIAADVKKLRDAGADLVICMPHWGTEYKRNPNATQRAWAQRMIAAGVDVIIGSHPHMVQPIETLTVETDEGTRTGLVAWSLGNFISNMSNQYTDSGIILEFTVVLGSDGTIAISDVGYVPVYVWHTGNAIRTVCSGQFLTEKPDEMSDAAWSRLKTSRSEMIALLGLQYDVLEK